VHSSEVRGALLDSEGHTKTIDVNENAVFFVSEGAEQQESGNGEAIR